MTSKTRAKGITGIPGLGWQLNCNLRMQLGIVLGQKWIAGHNLPGIASHFAAQNKLKSRFCDALLYLCCV